MRAPLWLLVAALAPGMGDAQRPNVVLILADDLGFGDVGAYAADSKIATPHLDRLAADGLRFTDAHAPSAVCTPTRYGLLTGRYAWRTSLTSGVLMGYSPPLIEADRFTMADLFKDAGYATACVGKWHLGLTWRLRDGGVVTDRYHRDGAAIDFARAFTGGPTELGFEHFFGCSACPTTDWLYTFLRGDRTVGLPTEELPGQGSARPHEHDISYRAGRAVPGWDFEEVDPTFVSEARSWLRGTVAEEPERPFFLYLPLSAPHAPWLPPERTRGATEEGPRGDMVALVDWAVGEVRAELEALGILDDTLIVFTSDNGPRIGLNGHRSAGPWRGYKSHAWEGGHRVPLIARWPGHVPAGMVSAEAVSLVDLLATFASLLETGLPGGAGEDSLDALPLLLGEEQAAPPRSVVLSHSVRGAFTLRRGRWKLILGTKGSGGWVPPADDARPERTPAVGQLYDLAADPAEERDLFDEHPEVVAELRALLDAIRADGHDLGLQADPALLTHGPLLGAVTPAGGAVWARAARPGDLHLRVMDGEREVAAERATAALEGDLCVTFRVSGLAPGRTYSCSIAAADGRPGPVFELATAPAEDTPARVRVAFGSCADDRRFPSQPIWTRMSEAGADAVVLLGDTPYIDSTEVEVQRRRYRELYSVPELAALMRAAPFYSTWDDHDFGRNDTTGELPDKERSRKVFAEYHPNPSTGEEGAGIYTRFRRGPLEVFLLDTRWFAATEPSPVDPSRESLLGARQWEWLRSGLAESTAPIKVLACGMVWNGSVRPLKSDHWARYAHEREALFQYIGSAGIGGVVLVGGDIHRSRVIRHDTAESAGYPLTELITSPLANFVIALANQPHPGLLWDAGVEQSFLMLTADTTGESPLLTARFVGVDGATLHELQLSAEDLAPGGSSGG